LAAQKSNYLIVWEKTSQVYSASAISTVLKTPVPKGCTPDDKHVLFISYLPDEKKLCVYPLSDKQIEEAIIEVETEEETKENE
jgi:hypothetical protein